MELHKFEENSKYGYRDENETIIIYAKYEDVKNFNENHAIVKYNGFWGVINIYDKVVIAFNYSEIEEHNLFFECKSNQSNQLNDSIMRIVWYNRNGLLLHEGLANALSEDFLCISNGKKYGVKSQDGKRIINCLYDEIVQKNNLFIVLRDDKLGLYDLSGNVILDVFCNSIESVIIENDLKKVGTTTFKPHKPLGCYYPGFCKEFYFDSEDYSETFLKRERIYVRKDFFGKKSIEFYDKPIKDINKPLIISTDKEKILFLKSEGVILDDGFEEIQQLTSVTYAVKKNNLWGIYRLDTKSYIIPIEYNRLKFYGGHTVLLLKDGLWGAKDLLLDEPSMIPYKVSIPPKYLEITILDDNQFYFGCKTADSYNNEYEEYYTIIKSDGEKIDFFDYNRYKSQFIYYDSSHLMTSQEVYDYNCEEEKKKYGFVSIEGHNSIPFKYNEICPRGDGRFDVRIEDRWGILTLNGRDNFEIKQTHPLPKKLDKNTIVQDAESECFGVINKEGVIIIPAIYEHLFYSDDNDFFYYLYNGELDGIAGCDFNNFAKDNLRVITGVVNATGMQIINGLYRCYEMQGEFIIAGRDGDYNYWAGSRFDGVYDLYNKKGELLIGGFREFLYDNNHELFVFSFGGEWKGYDLYPLDGQERSVEDYSVEYKGDDLWLILDKNLKTIIRNEDGEQKQFPKGFIGNVIIKKEGKKKRYIYNIPLKYLVKGFYLSEYSNSIEISSIIIKHGTQALDIATGKMTKEYSKIKQITESLFIYKDIDNGIVGVTNIDNMDIIGNCFLITYPVSKYIFVAKEKAENVCCVYLYDIERIANPVATAISDITKNELVSFTEGSNLKIEIDKNSSGLKSIVLPTSNIFDEEFIIKVSVKKERNRLYGYRDTSYYIKSDVSVNQKK